MNIPMNQFPSIEQMTEKIKPASRANASERIAPGSKTPHAPFSEILKEKQAAEIGELTFSKHANERLASRNIDLTEDQYKRLETGARKAGEKGIVESLVMVDNLAFIVNVRSNTVITAVNQGEERVFTNIDGAVII
jgi:flagellar operon protein